MESRGCAGMTRGFLGAFCLIGTERVNSGHELVDRICSSENTHAAGPYGGAGSPLAPVSQLPADDFSPGGGDRQKGVPALRASYAGDRGGPAELDV